MNRAWVWGLAGGLSFGCGEPRERYSEVGDEVGRDVWLDTVQVLEGDGATTFDSSRVEVLPGQPRVAPRRPYQVEVADDAGPATSVVGDHLLSLSRYRGFVSTRIAGPDAPRVEAVVPLQGSPVGFFLSEGVAAVLVIDPYEPACLHGSCEPEQTSRLVLVDVEDPASPRALGEHRISGTVFDGQLVGGALHVLSHKLPCGVCEGAPSDYRWLVFDRRIPGELAPPRVTPVPGLAFFGEERLFALSPGALHDEGAPEVRVAELSEPEPTLSAPVALGGVVRQAHASGDRLRVSYAVAQLDLETFSLGAGAPVSLGRGRVALPDGDSFSWLSFEGDRAFEVVQSGRLAVLDLDDPAAPRLASTLELELSGSQLTIAGDRVLAAGRSTRDVDAAPEGVIARGPLALVLVDIADLAAPRVVDRVTLGGIDSVTDGLLELRGERALFSYYEAFQGSAPEVVPEANDCGRDDLHLVAYDLSSGRLAPAVAFDGLDPDPRVEVLGGDFWVASGVAVSRYAAGSGGSPAARAEFTRSIDGVRALASGVALFGEDLASNAPTLEFGSPSIPLESAPPTDLSVAAGLPRVGCYERRRWAPRAMERDGSLYALRFHLPASGIDAPGAATLHVLDAVAPPATPSLPSSLELPPLAAGEDYLGAVQADRIMLIARGRREQEPTQPGDKPRSLFSPGEIGSWAATAGLHPDARLSYDVVDLSDPAAPALASRLDIDPALASRGLFFHPVSVTHDTAWGFDAEGLGGGPSVVTGSLLVGQHSEPAEDALFRFYLDRFDFSVPAAPVQLTPIEIPGSVLDFDAPSGGLITLDTLLLREPADSPACEGRPRSSSGQVPGCLVLRRALSGLVVDDARATRVGRLLLDDNERQAVRFAVSNGRVYYVMQPTAPGVFEGRALAARAVTLERVVLRDGRFERLPSFDIAALSNVPPEHWEQFAAKGERALWVAGSRLLVANFSAGGEPRLEEHDLGPGGCTALDLHGDTAYCAQGRAGYLEVTLGAL